MFATQQTNWKNVERALGNMKRGRITSPEDIRKVRKNNLECAVKPSGFYRQKAERLRVFSEFVISFGGFHEFSKKVTREQLLEVRGLGPETADSILLYALERPVFVIDAYTKRVFSRFGFENKKDYNEWREFFEDNLPRDVGVYKEFHALIVELGKNFCKTRPLCEKCILNDSCPKRI